jgi:hypothetical protein
MDGFRQGLLAKRIAVSAIALYALLLQAFAAAATPPAAFNFSARIACSEYGSRPEAPGDERGHRHGLCYILGCAACNFAHVATASAVAIFPACMVSAIVWPATSATATWSPLKFYFGARGPPQAS